MGNAFEIGQRKVIPAVLVYVSRSVSSGAEVLMIHRNSGRPDFHEGKWNGLGGKCEPDESPLEAACREVKEESGLGISADQMKPMGVIQFPNFKPHKAEDWVVFVFSANLPAQAQQQSPLPTCAEGELSWVNKNQVLSLNLWPGDRHFLGHVLQNQPVVGTIWYEAGQVKRHWIERLSF